jgi:hypothetical protein
LVTGTVVENVAGAEYEGVVPTRVRVDGGREPDRVWQGEVVDTAWRAAPDTLEVLRPELTEFPRVVVGTPIGGLLSPTDLPEGVREGTFVSWDGRRLDLFGFTHTQP